MKHDLYKLADQHHLNANEQQLLQAVLETAKTAVSAACESLQRRIIPPRRP
ncbi:MAG: bacteriocin immunity protein [Faecalibacterium sp.]